MTIRTARIGAILSAALLLLTAAFVLSRSHRAAPPTAAEPLQITCEVQPLGAETWSRQIKADDGATVRWRVHVVNTSGRAIENLCVRDIVPTGMTLVPGSVTVANTAHPDGVSVSDSITEDTGMNLGDYAPGGGAWIYFSTVIDRAANESEGNLILRNVVQTSGGASTGTVEADADVILEA